MAYSNTTFRKISELDYVQKESTDFFTTEVNDSDDGGDTGDEYDNQNCA